ncbi:hypothetical protein ACWEO2_04765 [Nocardia sp. NPDC004278]
MQIDAQATLPGFVVRLGDGTDNLGRIAGAQQSVCQGEVGFLAVSIGQYLCSGPSVRTIGTRHTPAAPPRPRTAPPCANKEEEQVRSNKVGAIAVALAAATVAAASPAQAAEPAPGAPNEIISIDLNLLGCSIGAGLGVDLVLALASSGSSSNASVSSGLAARLRAVGCLPWPR